MSSYTPIVANNGTTTGFKDKHAPDLVKQTISNGPSGFLLKYEAIMGAPSQMRVFIPPGTTSIVGNFYVFLSPTPGKGSLKFGTPPTQGGNSANISELGPVYTTEQAISGDELTYYFAGGDNNYILLINDNITNTTPLANGGWLYLDSAYPGGDIQRSLWNIGGLNWDIYTAWYNNAEWDSDGNPKEGVVHTATDDTNENPDQSPTYPEYSLLVGNQGFSGYRDTYSPDSLAEGNTPTTSRLWSRHSNLDKSKVKVFIPPGATGLSFTIVSYKAQEPGVGVAKMDRPPISSQADIVEGSQIDDPRKTLELLVMGEELKFYSPPESGTLTVATSQADGTFKSAVGGHIYFNFFAIPGGAFLSVDVSVYVNTQDYASWYQRSDVWDDYNSPLEGVTHAIVQSLEPEDPDRASYQILPLSKTYKELLNPDNLTSFTTDITNPPRKRDGSFYTSPQTFLMAQASAADMPYRKIKLFIPPGTRTFGMSWLDYLAPVEASAAASFLKVPVATASDVNADSSVDDTTLSHYRVVCLEEELYFYSPPNSQGLNTFQSSVLLDVSEVQTGGYLYINIFSSPGDKVRTMQFNWTIDETTLRDWYDQPSVWKSDGNPREDIIHSDGASDSGSGGLSDRINLDTGLGGYTSYNGGVSVSRPSSAGTRTKAPASDTLANIKDSIPLNIIYAAISQQKMRPTFAYETVIHTKDANLTYTSGIFLLSLYISRDYENAMTDYIEAKFSVPLGTFIEDIYPYLENCEVTLRVKKQFSSGGVVSKPVIASERYKAIFLKDKNSVVPNNKTQTKADLDQQLPAAITLQLLDRSAEAIRIKTTAGGVKYESSSGLSGKSDAQGYLENIFTQECKKILIDGKPIVPVVKVIKPDNNTTPKIATPSYTRIIEIPDYIQEKSQGLYNTSVGCFVQRFMSKVGEYKTGIYVYPVYKTKKTDTGITTVKLNALTATAVSSSIPGLVFKDGIYYGVCDKPMVKEADKESQVMSEGTGFRVANAESVMKRPYLIHKNGPVFSRQKLNTEIVFKERDDGVNYAVNKGVYTNNLILASEINKKKANFLTIKMNNLDHDLIRPDMSVMLVTDMMKAQSDGVTKREVKTYRCNILQMRVDYTNNNHNPVFSRNSRFTELTSSAVFRACYEIDGEKS